MAEGRCTSCDQACDACLVAGFKATVELQARTIGQLQDKIDAQKKAGPNVELGKKVNTLNQENDALRAENRDLKKKIQAIHDSINGLKESIR